MRVMVIGKASADSENGVLPDPQFFIDMDKFNQELADAGVWLAGEGLTPSSKGKRVTFTKGNHLVTDGPFAETKELIGGFWIWKVKSMEEAIEWVKKSPFQEGATVELRPMFDMEDFADHATPEAQAKERELRDRMAEQSKRK